MKEEIICIFCSEMHQKCEPVGAWVQSWMFPKNLGHCLVFWLFVMEVLPLIWRWFCTVIPLQTLSHLGCDFYIKESIQSQIKHSSSPVSCCWHVRQWTYRGDTQYEQGKNTVIFCSYGPPASRGISQLPGLSMPEIVTLWFCKHYRNKSKIYNDWIQLFFANTFHDPPNYWKYAHNFLRFDHGKHRYFSLVTYRMSQECTSLQVSVFSSF